MATIISSKTTGGGGLAVTGDASGILQLASADGTTAVTINASQKVTFAQPIQGGSITSSTAVASTSGTSIDFTGIPSWAKRITVMFNGVSINTANNYLIQLGTSGGIVSTGYFTTSTAASSAVATITSTGGFIVYSLNAANASSGILTICNVSGNIWTASGTSNGTNFTSLTTGNVTLGATLDRVRITTDVGTATFDAGSVNIMYEG